MMNTKTTTETSSSMDVSKLKPLRKKIVNLEVRLKAQSSLRPEAVSRVIPDLMRECGVTRYVLTHEFRRYQSYHSLIVQEDILQHQRSK